MDELREQDGVPDEPGEPDGASIGALGALVQRLAALAKGHRIACTCAGVLLVLAVACACFGLALAASVGQAASCGQELAAEYSALGDAAAACDALAVREHAAAVEELSARLEAETGSGLWAAARALPYYGSDLAQARELAQVAGRLAREAVGPVAGAYAGLLESGAVDGEGRIVPLALALHPNEAGELVQALHAAEPAVQDGAARLDALGQSHVPELNGAVDAARSVLDPLAQGYDELDTLLEGADSIGDAIDGLLK